MTKRYKNMRKTFLNNMYGKMLPTAGYRGPRRLALG
jgi:hypothetical protein